MKPRHGHATRTGMTSEYAAHHSMKQRCLNPNANGYKDYGGRGITICPRWLESFDNFIADIGPKPDPTYSLDRIDCNGPYCPENCRWASRLAQARNTRATKWITIQGETKVLLDWLKFFGVAPNSYYRRLKRGMTEVEALTHVRVYKSHGTATGRMAGGSQ